MKLKEYFSELKKLIATNPEALELEVIYAADDEGNGYQKVGFGPTLMYAEDPKQYHLEVTNADDVEEEPNVVCIN